MRDFFKFDEIENIVSNANIHIRDEELLLDDLKNVGNDLAYVYKTNNTFKFDAIFNDLNRNLKTICINSINNVAVLNKTAEDYEIMSREVKTQVGEIETPNGD